MNAVDSINKLNSAKQVQQILRKDPDNIAALLELATLAGTLKEPDDERKRTILNRVLSLDPINKAAREMLLEMDRAEMGGVHVQTMTPIIPIERSHPPTSIRSQNDPLEKPLVFRYSIWLQFLLYLLIAFTGYVSWQILQTGNAEVLLVIGAFLLFLIIPLWFISAVVEVSGSGIRFSRLFGIAHLEFSWDEMKEFRPNALGQGIKILTKEGQLAEISAQISGYSAIVEILQHKRPDLFSMTEASSPESVGSAIKSKTFQKNSLAKYGPLFLVILSSLLLVGTLVTAQCFVAIPIAIILFLLWKFTLHTPHLLKIEENRLSTKSFRKKQDLTAGQIKAIKMVSTYNRWRIARNHVRIELLDGDSFWLAGFLGGDEMMYGFLKNWWDAYQNT